MALEQDELIRCGRNLLDHVPGQFVVTISGLLSDPLDPLARLSDLSDLQRVKRSL